MNLAATIDLNSAGFQRGLQGATASVSKFKSGLISPMALAAGGIAAVTAAVGTMAVGIKKAADMEDLKNSFVTLLGSADAAKRRLSELAKFAAETPFDLAGIGKASKVLQSLTNGALATGNGLKMVGDMAAMSGVPIEDLSTTVGRLYSGLMSGREVGQAMTRLTELGLISAQTREKLEKLQASGKKGAEVWNVAAAEFSKYAGEMERKSKGWNGMLSTLGDNISMALAAFGEPIMDALKPYLESAISLTDTLTESAAKFGQVIGDGIAIFAAAWSDGSLTDIIWAALKYAFYNGINYFAGGLSAAVDVAGNHIWNVFKNLFSADFWKNLVKTAIGELTTLGSFLIDIFKTPLAMIEAGIRTAMQNILEWIASMSDWAADHLGIERNYKAKSFSENYADAKSELTKSAKDSFEIGTNMTAEGAKGLYEAIGKPLLGDIQKAFENFEPADLADTKSALKNLTDKIAPLKESIEAKRAEAAQKTPGTAAAETADAKSSEGFSKISGDSLSKIGGYVGFYRQQTDSYAKETAKNTKDIADAARQISDKVSAGKNSSESTFG